MPGLIYSQAYEAVARKLRATHAWANAAIEAAEMALLGSRDASTYPVLAQSSRGPVHGFKTLPTAAIPALVFAFAIERVGAEEKFLLLDITVAP